jgi:predicted outer membrane repeat protein
MKPIRSGCFLPGIAVVFLACQVSPAAVFNIANGDVAGLKSAITTANANGQDDSIELAANGLYTLASRDSFLDGLPQLGADGGHKLDIHGNGATIQRSTAGGTQTFRIFEIKSGASVTLTGLTLTNGNPGASHGGAIYNNSDETSNATLTIINCTITGNSGDYGGAIYNDGLGSSATLTVINSTISGNTGTQYGGGIWNDGSFGSATLNVSGCTFSGNSATLDSGAIQHDAFMGSASGSINNCTFSSNSAGRNGGGIYIDGESGTATLNVSNCTFSGNSAGTSGGAIFNTTGVNGGGAVLQIGNTIFKTGGSGANLVNNGGTLTSQGFNLSNDGAGGGVGTGPGGLLNHTGDQRNTDPLLDPAGLKNNGGATPTIALQAGSPAIDQGKRNTISANSNDQRGEFRPFDDSNIANAIGGDGSDIGAYEADVRMIASDRMVNDLRLTFTTILGRTYEVQSQSGLTGTWTNLPGTTPPAPIAGTGGIIQATVTNAFGVGQQFYRVQQLP